jgi:hypothetical protein
MEINKYFKCFLLALFLIVQYPVLADSPIGFKYSSPFYILDLPYEIPEGIKFVFEPDTPLAIKIIAMEIDGRKLDPLFNPEGPLIEPRTFVNLARTDRNSSQYHLSMYWHINSTNDILYWHDGRVTKYRLSRGMRELKIKYKVVIPSSSDSILLFDNLYKEIIDERYLTNEYWVNIDLSTIFKGP